MIDFELRHWLALTRLLGFKIKGLLPLIQNETPVSTLYNQIAADPEKYGTTQAALQAQDWRAIEADILWSKAAPNRHILTPLDDDYPKLLNQIPLTPRVLYLEGDITTLAMPALAIVGSRHPSRLGISYAHDFAMELAKLGFVIISGLAIGIDTASHQGALAVQGKTIAVLGSGLNHIYPKINNELSGTIAANGLLISEFSPNISPKGENFPRRNRIISGLSLGVLVVEAALKSGSLITANLANQQGREVFTIPGSLHNPLAKGCHSLIKQGAKLVENIQDILVEIAPQLCSAVNENVPRNVNLARTTLDKDHRRLVECLDFEPIPVDIIINRSGLSAERVTALLLELELTGWVMESQGGFARSFEKSRS